MSSIFFFIYCCLLFPSQATGQEDKDLELDLLAEGEYWRLYMKNLTPATMEIVFKKNKKDAWEKAIILAPSADTTLMRLEGNSRAEVAKAFNEKYDIRNYFGDPSQIKPDLAYLYTLPFKKNKKYRLDQGYFGKPSHQSIQSRYALDFTMDIGEPVYAARGGLVVKVISHFKKAGGQAFVNKANKILIMHDDGTVATYAHLNFQGSLVKTGDLVEQGQHIGYSGNTGKSGGPHLHFVVRKERDIAIPIFFKGYEGKELKAGKKYKRK